MKKYPGLLPELGRVAEKLRNNVQNPPARHESKLLPLLPESTTYYAGFPNYGEAVHQMLITFRQELKDSAVLRNWWQQDDMAKTGPQVEGFMEKFYELSQYLGDEIVISGDTEKPGRYFLLAAEVRKPGLKDFLRQMANELPAQSKQNFRVLDLQELATVKNADKGSGPVILVRPDFVIAAADVDSVRSANKILEGKTREFVSTPFGRRVTQAYEKGTTAVAAADLHKILSQAPTEAPSSQLTLQRSGFNDVKYLVWNHSSIAGQTVSEMELSFNGPRHGAAAWLAAASPLGSLDFVSPKSAFVVALHLKNPAEIFDEIKALSAGSTSGSLAALPQMEQAMHVSLRDDVLSQLSGELALEVNEVSEQQPQWTALLGVKDGDRLQKTLDQLFLHLPVQARQSTEDGISYHSLVIPAAQKPVQIAYACIDEYLIVASSRELAAEAIEVHKSGTSLSKSPALARSLPPGYSTRASALLYENASAMSSLWLKQLPAEMKQAVSASMPETAPVAFAAYGEESAIRTVSASGGAAASAILVGAAIAVPNLIRAQTTSNEADAVATMRSLQAAEVSYAQGHSETGFARDLSTLGPDPATGKESPDHAALIDSTLGNASCTAGAWCLRSGYRFSLKGVCVMQTCGEFVAVGTPISSNTGTRSYCSTSDGVIRFNVGQAILKPVTVTECRRWPPLR